jgi:hypothetical protein
LNRQKRNKGLKVRVNEACCPRSSYIYIYGYCPPLPSSQDTLKDSGVTRNDEGLTKSLKYLLSLLVPTVAIRSDMFLFPWLISNLMHKILIDMDMSNGWGVLTVRSDDLTHQIVRSYASALS